MSRAAVLLVTLTAGLSIASGRAEPRDENLVRNPDFDRDLSSWRATLWGEKPAPGAAAVWSAFDAEKSRTSGSLAIRTSAVHDRDSYSVVQCIDIPRPSEYAIFGGRIRVPPDQPVAGSAWLSLETFAAPGCAGSGSRHSGGQPVANADFWSKRIDEAMIRGVGSVRVLAVVMKQYEWLEGDESGNRDDHVPFQAFFDGIFLRLAEEADFPEPPRKPTAGFTPVEQIGKTSARWGKFEVDPPRLLLELPRSKRGTREDPVAVYSSNEAIDFRVLLEHPYRYDDPHRYPIEGLSVAAENVSRGLLERPTLELVLHRSSDPERKPLEIALTSSGGGGVHDGGSDNSVGVRLAGPSEYRTRAVRTIWECVYAAALRSKSTRAVPTPAPTPTDEQIDASPLIAMMPLNPPGDYELVARYQALAAGFWHEPIYSAPLHLRIVEKDFGCGSSKTNAP